MPPLEQAVPAPRAARPSVSKASLGTVSGTVVVPGRLLSDRGSGLIADRGAGLISDRGPGLISDRGAAFTVKARGLRLRATADRVGLPDARIVLTDATGRRLPGLAEARTDEAGRYQIARVPLGLTYLVVAEAPTTGGRTAQLRSIATAGRGEVTVSIGSTLVTSALVTPAKGLGRADPARLQALAQEMEARVATQDLPDLADTQAVSRAAEALVASDPSLGQQLEVLRKDLDRSAVPTTELAGRVAAALGADPGATPDALEPGSPGAPGPSEEPASDLVASPPATQAPRDEVTETPAATRVVASWLPIETPRAPTQPPTPAPTSTPPPARPSTPAPSSPPPSERLRWTWDWWANSDLALPQGLAVDRAGSVFVADTGSHRVLKSTLGGISVVAGATEGFAEGQNDAARFSRPQGIAVDGEGTLFVADTGNNRICKISTDGMVSTLVGGTTGGSDGSGTAASFDGPTGIVVAPDGTLYVADTNNHRVRVISPSGVVTTLAGSTPGYADGGRDVARLRSPVALALQPDGALLVADRGNACLRRITPEGTVSTVVQGASVPDPVGVAVNKSGTIYVADAQRSGVVVIHPTGRQDFLNPSRRGELDEVDLQGAVGLALDRDGFLYLPFSGAIIRFEFY
ncbi:MAG: hypothetical protein VKQ33_14105 [Candidatus Sericytochromatia bacterium]|nr:hypothetical protein [Candidatus Sericytochromatia bacterium]